MLLHLRVNEPGDVPLVAAEHLARVVLGQVGPEVLHGLGGQVVKQVGMIVIGDVVEVHQAADDVVFQPGLLDPAASQGHHFGSARPEILDPQFLGHRRVPSAAPVSV